MITYQNFICKKDTENIITHCVGLDFNSLYPSSYSSIQHPFIEYTVGKIYMPGRVLKYEVCNDKESKRKALSSIINDYNKRSKNPYLFLATV